MRKRGKTKEWEGERHGCWGIDVPVTPGAAAEALNKWDDGRARRGEVGLPLPSFGVRAYYPRETCEYIVSNLCNLMHFGV